MIEIPVALLVVLLLGTVAAVVTSLLLTGSRRAVARARTRVSALEEDLRKASHHQALESVRVRTTESEIRHLTTARIPDLISALGHPDAPVRGPLHSDTAGTELEQSLSAVLDLVKEAVGKERMRVDASAQAALRGASTTIQALLYQLQTLLQQMQEKHDDPLVAEDLLAADFLNEQALRRIQSTAVVCGAWPGLTRHDSHLADIVMGAASRLTGYERVQVANQLRDPVGVVARAVEPVAVVLTELMANALHYSHPDLPVAVTLQQGNKGASVIIDDAGVGMHPEELRRAARLMSGEETLFLTELGDPPRTGFAAVGRLVAQYGFSTHVETSPYGGVRAVVHVPGDPLLTLLDEEEQPMSAMAPLPPSRTSSVPLSPAAFTSPGAGQEPAPAVPASAHEVTAPSAEKAGRGSAGPITGSGDAREREASGSEAEGELPRRRRRRPVSEQTMELTGFAAGPERAPAAGSPGGPAPAPVSPERSASRWAAFQQGTASGRAAAGEGAAPSTGPQSRTDRQNTAGPRADEGNPSV